MSNPLLLTGAQVMDPVIAAVPDAGGSTGPAALTPLLPLLPTVSIECPDPAAEMLTRRGVLQAKKRAQAQRELAFLETRGLKQSPEKDRLYTEIRSCRDAERFLEQQLQDRFVPQHNPQQFLSPRAFFVSPLFCVRSKSSARQQHQELDLPTAPDKPTIRYRGPELRQSDGLVFLSLLHMMRDVRIGTAVNLRPEAVCTSLFGRYDGSSRHQLREHIQRLQQGLIVCERFSVQLVLRFDYPRSGCWTVALDPQIVELFRVSSEVWLRMQPRLTLPDGLATWLYAYVESQTRLIPMRLAFLRGLCGSQAGDKAFENRFRDALAHLARLGIIDSGWSVRAGEVRWRKPSRQAA